MIFRKRRLFFLLVSGFAASNSISGLVYIMRKLFLFCLILSFFLLPAASHALSRVAEGHDESQALLPRGEQEPLFVGHAGEVHPQNFPWAVVGWAGACLVSLLILVALWNWTLRREVRKAVRDLERSERKFREVFDNSCQFMALLDIEGRVLELNKNGLRHQGVALEKVKGQPFWELPGVRLHPESAALHHRAVRKAITGEVVGFESEEESPDEAFYLDNSFIPLFDDAGQVEMIIVEGRNITGRKKAERELQLLRDSLQERIEDRTQELLDAFEALKSQNQELEEAKEALRFSEEKYRALVENAGEGIAVVQEKTLCFCNPKMGQITGYDVEEMVGRPFTDFIHPDELPRLVANYQTRMSMGDVPDKYDFRIVHKQGGTRWLQVTAVRIQWETALASLYLLHDVTERKDTELAMAQAKKMAEDASAIMSDFVTMVSHELRTPMTSVQGFAKLILKDLQRLFRRRMLENEQLAERAQRMAKNLRIIIDESNRVSMLINDVLDLAKLEAKRYEWNFEEVSLETVIGQAIAVTSPLFLEKDLRLSSELAAELSPVFCDRSSLVQVVSKLLDNAAKFTEQGEVRVSAEKQGPETLIRVCDTGRGVREADKEKIFERFRQAGESLTDKPRGTGLGLSICKEIVEYHGGRIWVEDNPGGGSCFCFSLPLLEVDYVEEALVRG